MMTSKIPVTVLTGFLGSGKTTVLNRLLASPLGANSAVIVNEFGPVSIDAQLVVGVDEEILEINNGCICCTVRSDLIATITRLLESGRPIARILIETTGMADPAPVIQTFLTDDILGARTRLDAVVTVVDAQNIAHWLSLDMGDENTAHEQIAFADVLLLNKTDLADAPVLAACRDALRQINPLAQIHLIQNGEIAPEQVLSINAFDLQNALALEPALLSDLTHEHAQDIGSVVIRTDRPLDRELFFGWLNRMVLEQGRDLLRIKGIIALHGDARRYVFHGVHMTLDGQPGRPWKAAEPRHSEIVFIGRGLDATWLHNEILARTTTVRAA